MTSRREWRRSDIFADRVLIAANRAAAQWPPEPRAGDSGRGYRPAMFGPDKVFIDHVFAIAVADGYPGDLRAFAAQLVEAQKLGLLRLARADLVAAMDLKSVARSEIFDGKTRYHFVVI